MSEIGKYRQVKHKLEMKNTTKSNFIKIASKSDLDTTLFIVNEDFKFESIPSIYHRCTFTQNELEYNILDNIMVPKHQKVIDQELEEIKDQLPIILSYDPVVRRMNLKPGDIIKIDSSYYRLVK